MPRTSSHKKPHKLRAWASMLRIHQYVKNLLIFVPWLVGGLLFNKVVFLHSLIAFIGFCAIASMGYMVNDLSDLKADRHNPMNCHRAFAIGNCNRWDAIIVSFILLAIAVTCTCLLPALYAYLLTFYLCLSLSYTFYWKRVAIVDVFCLSAFYLIRLFVGAAAIGIAISNWLLAFVFFLFLSLSYLKRVVSLQNAGADAIEKKTYHAADLPFLSTMGISLGLLSLLVFIFYLGSDASLRIYRYPITLWGAVVLLLFWLNYMWFSVGRKRIHTDPIAYAIKDKTSWIIAACFMILLIGNQIHV